jgi:NTE family protein
MLSKKPSQKFWQSDNNMKKTLILDKSNINKRWLKTVVVVVCCFLHFICFSQTERQKVGLVLSGGGAKGFAHIGVLKVLEEAGVKIDYIGGTSIGAVIGGLYAAGYKARQLDSIFKNTNFDALINDYIPRTSKNFYEKRNDDLYAFALPFDKFKIGVPIALSKGLYNFNMLNKLLYAVKDIQDFSQLPIPFVCVATDIETGEAVMLKNGYLAQCVQASASFPTLYSPVEIDGKMLIDGGISNNYPVEEIRKMGADIIIGVDVQDNLKDRKSLKEATKIMLQITNLQMIEKMKFKSTQTDIYLKPDVSKYGILSFDERPEIIKIGEETAFAVYDKIKLLADKNNLFKRENLKTQSDSIFLNKIDVSDLKNYTRAYILGKLGLKEQKNISFEDLNIGISTLNATQNFGSINYKMVKNANGKDDLIFSLIETETKNFMKFSLHYDNLYKSGLLTNFTCKNAFFKNDVASVDIVLGDNFRYNFDYYIDNGFYWSFGIKSKLNSFNRNLNTDFSDGSLLHSLNINTINIDFSSLTNQIYLQTVYAEKSLVGFGVEHERLKIKSETLQNTSQLFENSDYLSGFGYLKFDSYDNKYFPKKGVSFCGDFQTYLYSTDFSKQFFQFSIAKLELGYAKTFYQKTTLKLLADAGSSIGKSSVSYFDFVFGGYGSNPIKNFKSFYGYDFLSFSGNSYIKATATIDYEFVKKNHLNFAANFANTENKIFANTDWITKPKYSGYALGYGLETVIGPLEFKYTWSPEQSKSYAWISVGFWF